MNPRLKPRIRTITSASLVALVGAAMAVPTTANAATSTLNYIEHTPSTVTADALPTTQIDGIVWDQAIVGNTVYAGGEFANARPAGAAAGTSLSPRSNLLSYNLTTGVLQSFAPVVNGKIKVVKASPDGKTLYIGGSFTTVNGQPRNRIAAFNTADGSLVASFHPVVNGDVNAIAPTSSTVYYGGLFSSVDGVARTRLAASSTTGSLLSWAPTADLYVNGMALTPDGSKLAIGGSFEKVNGAESPSLAFLSPVDGTLYPFAANQVVQNYGDTSGIYSLKSDGKNILATAWWYGGVGNFEGVLSATPDTGQIRWMADCHGDSYDATTIGNVTYSVSHHHFCGNMGSFPEQTPRAFERAQAFTDEATTTTQPNTQGGYGDFTGQPAPSQIDWAPDLDAGNVSGAWQAAWTAESTDKYLVLGGEFPRVNGVGQQGLVRFAVPGTAPSKSGPKFTWNWNPVATVIGTAAKVSWPANVDRDNMQLTYKLFRSDRTAPLYTTTANSEWFNRPQLGYLDTSLVVGKSYSYWVTATDADGNVASSARVSVTAGTTSAPNTPYSQAVGTDGAEHYWRLLEPSGTTDVDWRDTNDLTLGSGVALGADGAITGGDDAATFDGTDNGRAVMNGSQTSPDTFSSEVWFNTTTTAGGKLIGFGNAATGNSGSYDRHVYMDAAGHLNFGVYNGSPKVITTTGTFNDGSWHHVVASMGADGMELWVDGRLVAGDATVTQADDYTGYWHLGGDSLSGWPNTDGAQNNFAGTLDEAAIYDTQLTQAQVRNHYTLSGRTLPLPAQATDLLGATVLADNPELYWRMDETGGTVEHDATANLDNGTITGNPTFRVPSTVTDPAQVDGAAIGFDGQGTSIASDRLFSNPQVFSVESWVKTTTTSGGRVIGFGNARTGLSTSYDRQVWLDPQGIVHFGVYNGNTVTVDGTQPVNDGQWHHLVASMGPNGMSLYVDGVIEGTNPNTVAQPYNGYWRVGGDSVWSGSQYLDGTIDDSAVYSTVLSADQVRSHYRASTASVDKAPVASFTKTCDGDTCTFDASASSDADGSVQSYTWDFGDGTRSSGAKVTRTFAKSGTYDVTLTVADDQTVTGTATQQVSVTVPNKAPVANIDATCTALDCTLDSTGSTDPDGTIASVAWDFGDGATSTDATAKHSYAAAGTYTVTLAVTDDQGATTTTTRQLTVSAANALPTATFTTTVKDLAASFDATGSKDSDGTIASYAWDFGDGATGTGATPAHTWAKAGTYTVTLTVTDNDGGSSVHTEDVTVTAPANVPPVAKFTATVADRTVSVDASGSTDSDGTIASVAWDFGDGTTGTGTTATHTYVAAGSYTVAVTVTDNDGASTTTSQAVTVAQVANVAPTAAFTHTEDGLTSSFDATGSKDSDGSIASYAWDFGDGSTGSGARPSHTWAAGGTYTVKLTVTDDGGATDVASSTVTVVAPKVNAAPVAAFTHSETGLVSTFDATASKDSDGTIASYAWNFGDGTTGSGATPTHAWTAPGTYPVTLTVTDDAGATGQASSTVTVSGPVVVAADAFGDAQTRWGTADVGGSWTYPSGGALFSTNAKTGLLTIAAGQTGRAVLTQPSVQDSTTTLDLSLSATATGSGLYTSVISRYTTAGYYSLGVRQMGNGTVSLLLYRTVAGTTTTLKETTISGLTYQAGTVLHVSFATSGNGTTQLAGMVWADGSAQPRAAQITATDTTAALQVAGGTGINAYLSGSATASLVQSVDNLSVTKGVA